MVLNMVSKTPQNFSQLIFKSLFQSFVTLIGGHYNHFLPKKDAVQKMFYDLGWAIKVYGLGYGIQDTIKFFSQEIFKSPFLLSEIRIGRC